jgi:hypothetical protein
MTLEANNNSIFGMGALRRLQTLRHSVKGETTEDIEGTWGFGDGVG